MLYKKLGRPALGKTMGLVSQAAAEEIVQDVFTKAWEKGMVFTDLRQAYAWVYRCCTNAAIDQIRSKGSGHDTFNEEVPAKGISMEDQAMAKQLWKQLLHRLSSEEAAVFIYRNIEGLTQDEVVEVMQISRRTVNRIQEKLDKKIEALRGGRHVA